MPVRLPDPSPWLWGIGITALLLVPLPTADVLRRWPALARELTDFAHPVVFAWFAHVLFRSLRRGRPHPSLAPYGWVVAGTVLYAAATELVQALVGRQPSLADFRHDLLGASFALLLHWRSESLRAPMRLWLASLAVAGAVISSYPLALTLGAYAHRAVRFPVLWEPDSRLFAQFSRRQPGASAALMVLEPHANWRGHGELQIDIENPQELPQPVVVRVHDRWHDLRYRDRFNRRFDLAPRSRQTLRIALEDVRSAPEGRTMDLAAIRGIVVFSVARDRAGEFTVHHMRLAP